MRQPFQLKNGYVFLVAEAPGGVYSAAQLREIAQVAEAHMAFAKGTPGGRLGFLVAQDQWDEAVGALAAVGLGAHQEFGEESAQVVPCLGAFCPHALQDALGDVLELQPVPLGPQRGPVVVNGCSRRCISPAADAIAWEAEGDGYRCTQGPLEGQHVPRERFANTLQGLGEKSPEESPTEHEKDDLAEDMDDMASLEGDLEDLDGESESSTLNGDGDLAAPSGGTEEEDSSGDLEALAQDDSPLEDGGDLETLSEEDTSSGDLEALAQDDSPLEDGGALETLVDQADSLESEDLDSLEESGPVGAAQEDRGTSDHTSLKADGPEDLETASEERLSLGNSDPTGTQDDALDTLEAGGDGDEKDPLLDVEETPLEEEAPLEDEPLDTIDEGDGLDEIAGRVTFGEQDPSTESLSELDDEEKNLDIKEASEDDLKNVTQTLRSEMEDALGGYAPPLPSIGGVPSAMAEAGIRIALTHGYVELGPRGQKGLKVPLRSLQTVESLEVEMEGLHVVACLKDQQLVMTYNGTDLEVPLPPMDATKKP